MYCDYFPPKPLFSHYYLDKRWKYIDKILGLTLSFFALISILLGYELCYLKLCSVWVIPAMRTSSSLVCSSHPSSPLPRCTTQLASTTSRSCSAEAIRRVRYAVHVGLVIGMIFLSWEPLLYDQHLQIANQEHLCQARRGVDCHQLGHQERRVRQQPLGASGWAEGSSSRSCYLVFLPFDWQFLSLDFNLWNTITISKLCLVP